jgi:cytochrome c553
MPNLIKIAVPLIAIFSATFSGSVFAADLDGKKLFTDKTCHTCHGKDANSPLAIGYPAIAGQSKEYIAAQMKDIKSGARNNGQTAAMKGIMHLVSDSEIDAIASYVSGLEYKAAVLPVSKAPKKKEAHTAAAPAHKAGKMHDGTGEKVWMTAGGEREEAMHLKADRENGIEVFEVCAGCHLTEGWGKPDGTFPQLAGQHRSVLIKQLADIRSKNRDNPTMYPFALPESIGGTQSMADVTEYISKLPMNPENGKGKWAKGTPEFDQGAKLFADNCTECHGEKGRGNAEKFYPRIQGQHYNYMVRQFEWIRDGKRRNANPDMVKQIKGFSDKDMQMVVNFVSRIPVPKEELAPSKDWLNPDYD